MHFIQLLAEIPPLLDDAAIILNLASVLYLFGDELRPLSLASESSFRYPSFLKILG